MSSNAFWATVPPKSAGPVHRPNSGEESPSKLECEGISISLWRSAFLSDKTGYLEDTNKSAERFLGEMLLTNAIAFSQEHSPKDWTFNYCAENARYRQVELKEEWPELKAKIVPPTGQQTPKNRWSYLRAAFFFHDFVQK